MSPVLRGVFSKDVYIFLLPKIRGGGRLLAVITSTGWSVGGIAVGQVDYDFTAGIKGLLGIMCFPFLPSHRFTCILPGLEGRACTSKEPRLRSCHLVQQSIIQNRRQMCVVREHPDVEKNRRWESQFHIQASLHLPLDDHEETHQIKICPSDA